MRLNCVYLSDFYVFLYPGSYFASHFIMGGEKFESSHPEGYLFGENSDLNFLGSRPVTVCVLIAAGPVICVDSALNPSKRLYSCMPYGWNALKATVPSLQCFALYLTVHVYKIFLWLLPIISQQSGYLFTTPHTVPPPSCASLCVGGTPGYPRLPYAGTDHSAYTCIANPAHMQC